MISDYAVWGLLVGLLIGLIPLVFGATRNKLGLGIGSFFACAISGAILGVLLAGPVCGYSVWRIINTSKSETTQTLDSTTAIELAFWQSIEASTSPEDFHAYLRKYPQGQFIEIAQNRLNNLSS